MISDIKIYGDENGELHGQKKVAFAYTGFYQKKEVSVSVTFDWKLSNGGGPIGASLSGASDVGLALLQMGDYSRRIWDGLIEESSSLGVAESAEMATCYAVSTPVREQLKHARKPGKP